MFWGFGVFVVWLIFVGVLEFLFTFNSWVLSFAGSFIIVGLLVGCLF